MHLKGREAVCIALSFQLFHQRLVFKGYEPMIGVIPAGTICRISLSKWWKPKDIDIEMRCYLQLSGWYL